MKIGLFLSRFPRQQIRTIIQCRSFFIRDLLYQSIVTGASAAFQILPLKGYAKEEQHNNGVVLCH